MDLQKIVRNMNIYEEIIRNFKEKFMKKIEGMIKELRGIF